MRLLILLTATAVCLSACDQQTQEQTKQAAEKTVAAMDKAAEMAKAKTKQAMDKLEQATGAEAPLSSANTPAEGRAQAAVAVLHPTAGHQAEGTVYFSPAAKGVKIATTVTGLSPGKHGYHVHRTGNCAAPDGKSAGPHFNLQGDSGNPSADSDRITGNLGDLIADENGNAEQQAVLENASLTGPKSIIGRSVVVHAKANDPSQPPTGAAGARVACGVIGIAEAPD